MTDTATTNMAGTPGALLVTIPDAARILAVGRSTIYELIGAGELATVHIRRAVRVPVDELRRFVAQRWLEGPNALTT